MEADRFSFEQLNSSIKQAHEELREQAGRAVNTSLTLRNWLIGFYISNHEQHGEDRAEYGANLLEKLSHSLADKAISRCEQRELRRYRQFYQTYPQIRDSLSPELELSANN